MALSELPAPLVDARVDLRDFQFLPLDVVRLRDSSLTIEASGDEFRAAVLLWCAAWHQLPAASLPSSDRALSTYAGYGRNDIKGWQKVRDGALRGFIECSDGRLYHCVLAEKANESWEGKLHHRHRKECDRMKKAAQRAKIDVVFPTYDQWKANFYATNSDRWEQNSRDVPDVSTGTDLGHEAGHGKGRSEGHGGDEGGEVPDTSPAIKGQGEGQGQGLDKSSLRSDSSSAAPKPPSSDARQRSLAMAERLAAVTSDAMAAYNSIMAKPAGLLAAATEIGVDKKRKWVQRCIPIARQICIRDYNSEQITAEFWGDYFTACNADDFKSGRQKPGSSHQNWVPDFEYLTRDETMLDVFEAAVSKAAA